MSNAAPLRRNADLDEAVADAYARYTAANPKSLERHRAAVGLPQPGDPLIGDQLHDRPQRIRLVQPERTPQRRIRERHRHHAHLTNLHALPP